VTLVINVEYTVERQGKFREHRKGEVLHEMTPPLYAKILNRLKHTSTNSLYVQPYYATNLHH
jgi:hypothetical protein